MGFYQILPKGIQWRQALLPVSYYSSRILFQGDQTEVEALG